MNFIKKMLEPLIYGSGPKYQDMLHSKQKVTPQLPNELFLFAKDIAITQLNQLIIPLKECHWLRNENVYPAFDHFNFMYKNKIFSVLIDIQDESGKSYLPQEYIKRQKYAAKVFNLVPCKFPVVTPKPYTFDVSEVKIKNKGWNLFHTQTGKEIIIDKLNYKKKEEFSIWELRNYGIKYTIKYLKSRNLKVNSYQDIIGIDPQIWFYDENQKRSWVVVRCLDPKHKTPFKKKELETIINKCYGYNGYYAELTIESSDKNNKKLYRGDNIRTVNFDYKQIHTVDNPKRDILEEDVRTLIKQSMGYKCISESKYSAVHEIPNYNDYLFKIGRYVSYGIDKIKANMILVPIKYKNNMEERKNLGLPVYFVTADDSAAAKQGYAEPKDLSIENQRANAIIIRKISGQDVSSYYMQQFFDFGGKNEKERQFVQFKMLLNIIEKYGKDAGIKTLELCKNGISVIPKNDLADGSPQYEFMDETTFYNNYKKFINSYIEYLMNLSDLPQESYNNAINNILSSEDFTYDFSHSHNTFINFETKEFNFIDFYYDKYIIENAKKINMIEYFRDALLGKNFVPKLRPYMLIFYPEDWVRFEQYAALIKEKINNAAPDKNKLKTSY